MARRKAFEHGQDVEVQRDVGAEWELAAYDRPSGVGRHVVSLYAGAPSRWRDICGHPTEFRWVAVPSVRIRNPVTK